MKIKISLLVGIPKTMKTISIKWITKTIEFWALELSKPAACATVTPRKPCDAHSLHSELPASVHCILCFSTFWNLPGFWIPGLYSYLRPLLASEAWFYFSSLNMLPPASNIFSMIIRFSATYSRLATRMSCLGVGGYERCPKFTLALLGGPESSAPPVILKVTHSSIYLPT